MDGIGHPAWWKGRNGVDIDGTQIVKETVLATPASTKVFEPLGTDYCCGGDKRLDEACWAVEGKACAPAELAHDLIFMRPELNRTA